MSTTFGIQVPSLHNEGEFETIEVAFRSSWIRWENPLAQLLPDNLAVEPLDNSAQGIYSIGDIKQQIKEQNETIKHSN